MSHTFEGKGCWIHYNSDLSGEVILDLPHDTVTITGNRIQIPMAGEVLLAFFRHLQEPGRALAPDTMADPDAVPALTAAGYIREQIERLRMLEPEMKSFGIGSERWAAIAMAIGTLAEKLHAVEREVKDDA